MQGDGCRPKKTVFKMKTAVVEISVSLYLTAAARRTAGTRLHSGKNETLALLEIDVRVHEHALGALL
jgi:hypothetical protein